MQILRDMAKLMRICVNGPGGKAGLGLYAIIILLELSEILLSLRMITWTKEFYDALQQMNAHEALRQIGIFALIVLAFSILAWSTAYLRKMLEMRWRKSLTSQVLDLWIGRRGYLRAGTMADGTRPDNPDQRIAEDCRMFLAGPAVNHSGGGIIPLSIDLISRIVGLFSYVAMLWSLSTFALDLSFIGINSELPRYMVWAAFVYVALSSGITHLLGRPLRQVYISQQKREADYRFALVRLRENAEAIALSGGDAAERQEIDRRFAGIISNWRRLMNRELVLSLFTAPYHRTVLRIPIFLALPAYFGGNVTFGGLMQLGSAFSNVVTTLSWFIFSYRSLAALAAATRRLSNFVNWLNEESGDETINAIPSPDGKLAVRDLILETPERRQLIAVPELTISKGEAVWLHAPSGFGKTTLLKAFAGVWEHGSGSVARPQATAIFLPQRPYMPIGGFAEAAAYPQTPAAFDAGSIEAAVERAGLTSSSDTRHELEGLSGGERQRLALARVFLQRPQWVFLDEATSALDIAAEETLLARLRADLPDTTFVIVAHRRPDGIGAMREINLAPFATDERREGKMEPA